MDEDRGKKLALYILKQYEDHCQTTVGDGDDADKKNLENATEAIKWVESVKHFGNRSKLDLDALSKKFDKILKDTTKEEIEQWLDSQRSQ